MLDTATTGAVEEVYESTNDTSGFPPVFANLSSPSIAWEAAATTAADDDDGRFRWTHETLLLWLPHALIACLLVLLVAVSFVRFHNKHGHRYRKSAERAASSAVTVARTAWTAAAGDAAAAPSSPPVAEHRGEDDYQSAAVGSEATRALFSVWTLRRGRVGDVVSSLPKAISKPVRMIGSTADECHELLLEKL